MEHLRFSLATLAISLCLFLGLLLFLELGRRVGVRQVEKNGPGARSGVGVVDSAIYGLVALLIGFSFSGAAGRFDKRRELIVEQVSAISTAWQRIATVPAEAQAAIRTEFLSYVDAVVQAYRQPPGSEEEVAHRADATLAQDSLWARSVAACLATGGEQARMLILPALNEMFDAVDKERLVRLIHPPVVVFVLLGVTMLAGALFAGYAIASGTTRNWLHMIGVTATLSIATFVIIELEAPRFGLVRVDAMDKALVELRATMK